MSDGCDQRGKVRLVSELSGESAGFAVDQGRGLKSDMQRAQPRWPAGQRINLRLAVDDHPPVREVAKALTGVLSSPYAMAERVRLQDQVPGMDEFFERIDAIAG